MTAAAGDRPQVRVEDYEEPMREILRRCFFGGGFCCGCPCISSKARWALMCLRTGILRFFSDK